MGQKHRQCETAQFRHRPAAEFVKLMISRQLGHGKGLCCSFAEGVSVQDVDWDARSLRKYQTTNATTNGHANALIKLVIAVMNGAFYSGFGA
jgi:hypothetical protein